MMLGSTISATSDALVIGTNDNSEDNLDFVGAFAISSGAAQAVDSDGDATANLNNDGTLTAELGRHCDRSA